MGKSKRFVQWFGANTENAQEPGRLLEGCRFVGIPFAGGMSEVPFFTANQILVNDLHRHIINLCRIVKNDFTRGRLIRETDSLPYHPDVLSFYQRLAGEEFDSIAPHLSAAIAYFVCVWMGRGGQGGTPAELTGGLPVRWNAHGGGSNRRYRTAIAALEEWGKAFKRCEFVCMDALPFVARFEDKSDHGLYVDANWPGVGDGYTHAIDEVGQERLAALLGEFERTKVVVRFGEHPLIARLYSGPLWRWIPMESRTQANKRKPEFLICNFGWGFPRCNDACGEL